MILDIIVTLVLPVLLWLVPAPTSAKKAKCGECEKRKQDSSECGQDKD